jgi:hypothetical protein
MSRHIDCDLTLRLASTDITPSAATHPDTMFRIQSIVTLQIESEEKYNGRTEVLSNYHRYFKLGAFFFRQYFPVNTNVSGRNFSPLIVQEIFSKHLSEFIKYVAEFYNSKGKLYPLEKTPLVKKKKSSKKKKASSEEDEQTSNKKKSNKKKKAYSKEDDETSNKKKSSKKKKDSSSEEDKYSLSIDDIYTSLPKKWVEIAWVQPVVKAGDILCFDQRLPHRNTKNKSSIARIACFVSLYPKSYLDKHDVPPCDLFEGKASKVRKFNINDLERTFYQDVWEERVSFKKTPIVRKMLGLPPK